MKFKKPNFDYEWEEAKLRKGLFNSKKEWFNIAKTGSPQIINCSMNIGNTDMCLDNQDLEELNPDKVKRAKEALKRGVVELPIVLHVEDRYEVLAGNTRLTAMNKANVPVYAWVIEMPHKKIEDLFIDGYNEEDFYDYQHMEESKLTEKWSQKYKDSIDCNNPKGFSQRAHCQGKKKDAKESTGADSAGAFDANAFGGVVKRGPVNMPNKKEYNVEMKEATDASSSGAYDVPFLGTTPKGRKNPLSIGGEKTIKQSRAAKDPNFPKWGGPGGKFVAIKEKCKKFPYCNQGDMNALELFESEEEFNNMILESAKKHNLSIKQIEELVFNNIKDIFI